MDTKGRVSIPSSYREELVRRSPEAPILTLGRECLELYPFEDWQAQERQLKNASTFDVNVAKLRRWKISGCAEAKIDTQGRLQIPPFMRDHAHLGRDVVVAGVGDYVELWDKARFEADISATQAQLDDIQQLVSEVEKGS